MAEPGCDTRLRTSVVGGLNHRDLLQQAVGFGEGPNASFPVFEPLFQHPGRFVSEPDITSSGRSYEYLNALKDILIYYGVSDCDMEKGMVRCDVNVSVRPVGTTPLGAKD